MGPDNDDSRPVSHAETRYYHTPPDKKTLSDCANHGSDHAAYGWTKRLDPGWSPEQRAAYRKAYREYKTRKGTG